MLAATGNCCVLLLQHIYITQWHPSRGIQCNAFSRRPVARQQLAVACLPLPV